MELISDEIFYDLYKTFPINNLQVIGTHDSACYQLINGNTNSNLVRFANMFKWIPFVNNIIRDWTLTQDRNLYYQLKMGIRAFDLRVTYDPNTQDYYFSHTFFCVRAKEALNDIHRYFLENPHGFLFMIIKPDYEHRATFTPERNKIFKELIYGILGNMLIPKSFGNNYPKLETCIDNGKNIMCAILDMEFSTESWIWGSGKFIGKGITELDDEKFYQEVKHFVKDEIGTISHISLVKTPTNESVKRDVKMRLTCKGRESLLTWSQKAYEILERLRADSFKENFYITTNIFWLDFPVKSL